MNEVKQPSPLPPLLPRLRLGSRLTPGKSALPSWDIKKAWLRTTSRTTTRRMTHDPPVSIHQK